MIHDYEWLYDCDALPRSLSLKSIHEPNEFQFEKSKLK